MAAENRHLMGCDPQFCFWQTAMCNRLTVGRLLQAVAPPASGGWWGYDKADDLRRSGLLDDLFLPLANSAQLHSPPSRTGSEG